MPTFSTLDAKLLNDAIGTVNENLTTHHKENATTLLAICKDLGEHFTPQLYALDRIEKKRVKKWPLYEWTLGINGAVIIGRKWDDFIHTINHISKKLKLNKLIKNTLKSLKKNLKI